MRSFVTNDNVLYSTDVYFILSNIRELNWAPSTNTLYIVYHSLCTTITSLL